MKRLGCVIGVKENEGKETQPVDDNVAVKRGADSRIICKNSHSNLIFDSVDDAKLQNCSIQNLSLASRGWLFARSFASPLFWGRVRDRAIGRVYLTAASSQPSMTIKTRISIAIFFMA
ncbi:uncharacterized protein ARB_05312 [Trichophyton benhamiae CBS 112371]|uniref:Uncharacterized protein n=1 Tax=Arthroderma benhamiae (strain ATCC MYA-4681 / CBS 112371) TaxID=663331 RepID=D4ALW4_ARTBC|nr:uncharacterized protein ARB_05312 [Trichophyton benhamiae CBS 112371]EFE36373.1 hypothetical protein ARB_05312 [Trichophyton benhamiae CBS 112371]